MMEPWTHPRTETVGGWRSWAMLSPCRRYRYALGRAWDGPAGAPVFAIVMLNPSTADHQVDDPTIRKVIHFAKQEGCRALLARNLSAFRATDPAALRDEANLGGDLNLEILRRDPGTALLRVAAWGKPRWQTLRRRLAEARHAAQCTHVLALTKDCLWPRHPLYLPNASRAMPWPQPRAARNGAVGRDA